MFPGFGSDELYLKALEKYLQKHGYQTEGWGLGKNLAGMDLPHTLEDLSATWEIDFPQAYSPDTYRGEGGVPFLADKAIAQVRQRSSELGSPVVLIGWSLGGYIAREVARELPDQVAQIITFGAPAYGGPKYSRVAGLFKAKQFDLDWIEESVSKRDRNPIKQPITAIYSKLDGIVSWTAAIDTTSPNVTNIEVSTSHLGMGFSLKVWKIVADALQQGANDRSLENEALSN
jgi:pimeloyl-ACP methyl ester carboxylesterase